MEYLNSRMRIVAVWDVFRTSFHWELQYKVKTWVGYMWICAQYSEDTFGTISSIRNTLVALRDLDRIRKNRKRKGKESIVRNLWVQKTAA